MYIYIYLSSTAYCEPYIGITIFILKRTVGAVDFVYRQFGYYKKYQSRSSRLCAVYIGKFGYYNKYKSRSSRLCTVYIGKFIVYCKVGAVDCIMYGHNNIYTEAYSRSSRFCIYAIRIL